MLHEATEADRKLQPTACRSTPLLIPLYAGSVSHPALRAEGLHSDGQDSSMGALVVSHRAASAMATCSVTVAGPCMH